MGRAKAGQRRSRGRGGREAVPWEGARPHLGGARGAPARPAAFGAAARMEPELVLAAVTSARKLFVKYVFPVSVRIFFLSSTKGFCLENICSK